MADQYVQVPADSGGKKVDCTELTVGAHTVQRQRINITDDDAAAGIAQVLNAAPAADEYGLVTRMAGEAAINDGGNTITVDGAVTANIGTSGNLALDATLTDGTQVAAIKAGGNTATVSAAGALKVDGSAVTQPVSIATVPSHAVTNAGTFAVQVDGSALTALQLIDDVVLAEDAAHQSGDVGVMGLAVRKDAGAAIAGTDGDYTPLQVDADGNLRVNVATSGTLTVSGTVTANVGTSGSLALAAPQTDGTQKTQLVDGGGTVADVTASNALKVDGSAVTQPVSGTVTAAQATASSLNAQVVGEVAHDAADSGNPVKIGGVGRTANATGVTAGDRVNATFDVYGRQAVVLNNPRELISNQTTTITNSTTETTIVTAAASTLHDLTHLSITNATATACTVTIKDATAGTTRAIYALAASGGIVLDFGACPWKQQAAANNNWTATLSVNTVTVYLNAQFVKNAG